MKTYTPTKGRAVIQFKDHHANVKEAGFIVPGMAEDRRDSIGTVVDINYKPFQYCDVSIGDTVIVPTYVAGTKIGDSREIIRIDDITAVIQGASDAEIAAIEDMDIQRCKYCGPAKPSVSSNGVMLEEQGPNGVLSCPRCKKDVNGQIPDDTPHISDGEVEKFKHDMGIV